MTLRAVITDLYGTIVYEEYGLDHMYADLAAMLGASPEEIARARALSATDAMLGKIKTAEERAAHTLRALGRSPDHRMVTAFVQTEYASRIRRVRLYPSTRETLVALRQRGIRLGLLSNATYFGRWFTRHCGLEDLYDTIVISSEVGLVKPDPRIYHLICQRLGVQPVECVYIGDGADNELVGARSVGMTTVLIHHDHGFSQGAMVEGYQHMITSLADILAMVDGHDAVR